MNHLLKLAAVALTVGLVSLTGVTTASAQPREGYHRPPPHRVYHRPYHRRYVPPHRR
ncbi:hypothetical protein [Acidisphaera sp. L21]|uniref:hypothetical protein n=1 Tax=Acidisphaera sp. L21 TaxID=1641851 RepID=UPI00131D9711|nr:hypothetical protein [Acidisphaera sp. L21]